MKNQIPFDEYMRILTEHWTPRFLKLKNGLPDYEASGIILWYANDPEMGEIPVTQYTRGSFGEHRTKRQ